MIKLDDRLNQISRVNKKFSNWSKVFKCKPELFFMAENEDDIIKVRNDIKNLFLFFFFFF